MSRKKTKKKDKKVPTYPCFVKKNGKIQKSEIILVPLDGSMERIDIDEIPSNVDKDTMVAQIVGQNQGYIINPPSGGNGIERAIMRTIKDWVLYIDKDTQEVNWIPHDRFKKCLK